MLPKTLTRPASLLIVLCAVAWGAQAKDNGVPNGQPFQALQEQIDLNSQAIADLQAVTAQIQVDVQALQVTVADHEQRITDNANAIAGLRADLSAAQSDLDTLEGLVAANTEDIASASYQIDQLRQQVAANREEMLQAVAALQQNLADQQHQIDALRVQIADLRTEVHNQIDQLNATIQQVRQDLQNQADLTAAQLATVNFQITLMLADIQSLQGALLTLQTDFDTLNGDLHDTQTAIADINNGIAALDSRIAAVETQVASLSSRVSALESFHNLTYSEQFLQGQIANATQIQHWAEFRAQTTGDFRSISISSSNGGHADCNDAAAATQICNALNVAQVHGPTQTYLCGGTAWHVGTCGVEVELNAGSSGVCWCDSAAAVRPGLAQNSNWGGVGSLFGGLNGTCFAPSQTLTVTCGR